MTAAELVLESLAARLAQAVTMRENARRTRCDARLIEQCQEGVDRCWEALEAHEKRMGVEA
jgi:hypothetical protein